MMMFEAKAGEMDGLAPVRRRFPTDFRWLLRAITPRSLRAQARACRQPGAALSALSTGVGFAA